MPRRNVVKDVDERLCAEGDIEMKPKTALKIVSRTNTPKPSSAIPMSRIIQAISTPKKETPLAKRASKSTAATPMKKAPVLLSVPTPKPLRANSAKATPRKRLLDKMRPEPTPKKSRIPSSYTIEGPELAKGLLVWAKWRPQYYTCGVLEGKASKSRDVWQVRPLHRQSATVSLSPDNILPISILSSGDTILHIIDRRKYKTKHLGLEAFQIDNDGRPIAKLNDGTTLFLEDVVIGRSLFLEKHKVWRSREEVHEESEIESDIECRRYSLTEKGQHSFSAETGIFNDLQFCITGSNDKSKLIAKITENGGRVIEELEPNNSESTILIYEGSAASCRTPKYFSAVLLGIQRLKVSWINACVSAGKLVSKTSHRLDSQVPLKPRMGLFFQVHICFVGSKSFKDSCHHISSFTDAIIVDQRKLASYKDVSVIVVLESPDVLNPRLQATCLSIGHLIAEKSWFTDSILAGAVLSL